MKKVLIGVLVVLVLLFVVVPLVGSLILGPDEYMELVTGVSKEKMDSIRSNKEALIAASKLDIENLPALVEAEMEKGHVHDALWLNYTVGMTEEEFHATWKKTKGHGGKDGFEHTMTETKDGKKVPLRKATIDIGENFCTVKLRPVFFNGGLVQLSLVLENICYTEGVGAESSSKYRDVLLDGFVANYGDVQIYDSRNHFSYWVDANKMIIVSNHPKYNMILEYRDLPSHTAMKEAEKNAVEAEEQKNKESLEGAL